MFMNELYQKNVSVPGVIMEFGCRWGANLISFTLFRGMYEPYNHTRKIIGFDTFEGFKEFDTKDGTSKNDFVTGDFSVSERYEDFLQEVLDYHEKEGDFPHIKKYQIIKGDAPIELENYLKMNPETIVSLAYFDMDLYKPTKDVLEILKEYMVKGSVIGFDELNLPAFPGETIAVKEVLGLRNCRLLRSPYCGASQAYMVVE
jgi:hypothetical protein